MRKSVLCVAVVSLFLGPAAVNPAMADDAKPLVVMSLADRDGLVAKASSLDNVAKASEIPVWLQSMLRLYIEGGELNSLDSTRPWGAVLQIDGYDDLSGYCFIPVTDAQGLLNELSEHIKSPTDIGNGIFRIDSAKDDKFLFAKVTEDGWIIAGDNADVLADAPSDPGKLVKGLNKSYDFALQLNICNIPSYHGQVALEQVKSELNDRFGIEALVPADALGAIYEAVEHLDQITLGWSRHK